jgi:hypothetical protein
MEGVLLPHLPPERERCQPQALFSYTNYMPKVQERKANKTFSCIFICNEREVNPMGYMRQIFIVNAFVVDANGTFNNLSGYPKTFDSKNYQNDIEKTQRRAEGDMSETWGAMCKVDTRQIQTVTLSTVDGFQIEKRTFGQFNYLPEVET